MGLASRAFVRLYNVVIFLIAQDFNPKFLLECTLSVSEDFCSKNLWYDHFFICSLSAKLWGARSASWIQPNTLSSFTTKVARKSGVHYKVQRTGQVCFSFCFDLAWSHVLEYGHRMTSNNFTSGITRKSRYHMPYNQTLVLSVLQ